MPHPSFKDSTGFTLVEVLVALSLLAVAALGMADLIIRSVTAAAMARQQTIATTLAVERMEQLRALTWGLGNATATSAQTDTTTDLTSSSPAVGGAGLQNSPPAAADVDTPGYVDASDSQGFWTGAGLPVPARARFVRRWSLSNVPGMADALVLQVGVAAVGPGPAPAPGTGLRLVKLVGIKARTAF